MRQKIADSVLVLTGASSGIGRGTALELARRGAKLVLAARGEEPLREVAAECERLGAYAIAVPTDTADEGQVEILASRAVEQFGRIDVWINNAAVTAFGRFEELPSDIYRHVIETDLFGYTYGARAAIARFREQGSGMLINNLSFAARTPIPYQTPYVASKFALYGLSQSLRQELLDQPDIRVCTILPASVDTPLFQHAANYSGRQVKPVDPVHAPEEVISAIVGCIDHPKDEVCIGATDAGLGTISRRGRERAVARLVERGHFQDAPASQSRGNVFEPMPQISGMSGGWPQTARTRGFPVLLAVAGLTVGGAILGWYWLQPKRRRRLPTLSLQRRRPSLRDRMEDAVPAAVSAGVAALPLLSRFVSRNRRPSLAHVEPPEQLRRLPQRLERLAVLPRRRANGGRQLQRPARRALEALRR